MKSLFTSKTLIINAATVGAGIYAAVENGEWLANNPWILAALGGINIALRCVTNSPLFSSEEKEERPINVNLNISKEDVKQLAESIENE